VEAVVEDDDVTGATLGDDVTFPLVADAEGGEGVADHRHEGVVAGDGHFPEDAVHCVEAAGGVQLLAVGAALRGGVSVGGVPEAVTRAALKMWGGRAWLRRGVARRNRPEPLAAQARRRALLGVSKRPRSSLNERCAGGQ
jgi:hypothetical protein